MSFSRIVETLILYNVLKISGHREVFLLVDPFSTSKGIFPEARILEFTEQPCIIPAFM